MKLNTPHRAAPRASRPPAQMVLLVAGASLGIATLVGTFVTTWMTGKIARMNPAAVFVSLLFWGWLLGGR